MSDALEFNFDSLVGPTHNYAGLAHGNLASQNNRRQTSSPLQAALEGLEKMKFLADLGVPQVVLPPHERPHIPTLRRLGFSGTNVHILSKAAQEAPQLLAACASASAMWAANAATISPSPDTSDGLLHITPANLAGHLHRSLETPATAAILRAILPGLLFAHHDPLPSTPILSDEGAANHNRLCLRPGDPGIELFVYGHDPASPNQSAVRFSPRQSRTASEAIARLHQLPPAPDRTIFAQQHPDAIDAGVFHNDVISVAHRQVFLYHERAFVDTPGLIDNLRKSFATLCGTDLITVAIPESILPLADAVRSYLFNSQLVSLPNGKMFLLAPAECQELPTAAAAITYIREHVDLVDRVHFIEIRQSMRNGGGPACLRLRIVLTPEQQVALHPGVRFTDSLYARLRAWIERHYRTELHPADLADPQLLTESRAALDELTCLLNLPPLYTFQQI